MPSFRGDQLLQGAVQRTAEGAKIFQRWALYVVLPLLNGSFPCAAFDADHVSELDLRQPCRLALLLDDFADGQNVSPPDRILLALSKTEKHK